MIDYLLKFSSEAEAQDILSTWVGIDEHHNSYWQPKAQSGIMPIRIILSEAIYEDNSDGEITLKTPETQSDGWWLAIARPQRDETLWALTQCLHETDRAAANSGQSYHLRTKLTPEQISSVVRVDPVFAGSQYPF